MKIDRINNQISPPKNQLGFSGLVNFLEPELEKIPALQTFKELVKDITYDQLEVSIQKMPITEAMAVTVDTGSKSLITKLQNIKITYFDKKKPSLKESGVYLHPNKKHDKIIAKKNDAILRDNLITNAPDSTDQWFDDLEGFLNS